MSCCVPDIGVSFQRCCFFFRPREGNVFTGVCQHSYCLQGGGHLWYQVPSGGVSLVPDHFGGGMSRSRHPPPATDTWRRPPHVRSASGQYASYWNASLFSQLSSTGKFVQTRNVKTALSAYFCCYLCGAMNT